MNRNLLFHMLIVTGAPTKGTHQEYEGDSIDRYSGKSNGSNDAKTNGTKSKGTNVLLPH